MAAFNKFNCFVEDMAEEVHNLGSDTLKIALTNTAPVATQTVFEPVTLHPPPAAANGYTTGGSAVTITASSQTAGLYKLVGNDVVFTATAGGIGPLRYAILYNDSSAADSLIGWWDYASSITLLDTETLTVDLDQTNRILTNQ